MSASEALLARIVDYAGLFPPSSLDMDSAVKNHHRYVEGRHAWMLGNFVLPANRLGEFKAAFERFCCTEQEAPWTLSIVCTGPQDLQALDEFQEGAVFIRSLELKADSPAAIQEAVRRIPSDRFCYMELTPDRVEELLPVLFAQGARAKLRTGGLTADAIPSVQSLARFLLACARERVPWKATAGLHHAVRGLRPLTDEPGSPQIVMHGFMNIFLAGALAWFGEDEPALIQTLEEENREAFQVFEDVIRWHGHTLITDQIEQVRSEFAISFGSCSFTEPVEDVEAFGWV